MAEKRTTFINLRLSQKEKEAWQEKAARAGVPLSNLIRQAMARTQTWTANDRAAIQERTRQLIRIGNNLNQIAKWANTYKETAEALEVIEALDAVEQALNQLSLKAPSSRPGARPSEGQSDAP